MNDQCETRQQLLEKLTHFQQRVTESEVFRSLFLKASVPTLVATPNGLITQVNQAFCDFLGYSEPEFVGKTVLSITHPADRDASSAAIHRAVESVAPIQRFEKRYLHENGQARWGEVSSTLIFDSEGKPDYFFAQVLDITERKQAEEALKKAHEELEERVKERTAELTAANKALQESEENFRTLVNMLPDAVFTSDTTGRITFVSCQALQMYGTENAEEMTEKDPVEFFDPKDRQKFLTNVQKTLTEGMTRNVLYDLIRKDGTRFIGEMSARKLNDMTGKPKGFVSILRDTTERRRAEEMLQQSHDELRAIYDGMVEGLLVTDVETLRFVRVNASICRMLGYSEDELLSLSLEDIHPAESIPDVLKKLKSAEKSNYIRPGNVPFLRKDGSVFYTEAIGESLIYDGRPCSMGIFRDITERLQAQEALEQERQMLWKMLQASDHERQTISYDIHDGLAQYLAAAGMGFQTYDSIKENAPDEARKAYEAAVELVRQAHLESRRLIGEVRHPVIDERGLATAIVSLAYEQQQRGGPRIECHTSVEFNRLPPILENALYRIAQEALTNACKHSKSKKVTVIMIQEGQDVRLEIQDWGIGFDTGAIEKGHFGLESIRQRVRLLGGQMNIKSKPDSGTLVQVVVPILEKHDEE